MLGVGLLCLALLGPAAALRASSAAGPIAAGCVAARSDSDWGAPDWTLEALATPARERVIDARDAAQAALGPRGDALSLLWPARFALSPTVGPGVLSAYAWLAGVRQPPPAAARHEEEITQGARRNGVSPLYLLAVARAESGLSTYARARASSAAGLFQFVEQTWLRTLRRFGPGIGLAPEAAEIRLGSDGRARVADPLWRSEILALRYDPVAAAQLAGALTRENASALRAALGRPPTAGELYAAHLLGPGQALLLLSTARVAPSYPARTLLPAAAASNRSLFYAGGAPRSVRGVVGLIAERATGGAGR